MKEKSILILIVLFLVSCGKNETNNSLYIRTDFDVEIADEVYTESYPINFNQIQNGRITKLIMQADQDTVIYELSVSDKNGGYIRNGKRKPIVLIDKKDYRINRNVHSIYKYGLNMIAMDGCSTHFWSPEYGILLIRSATWGGFSQLKPKDENELIDQLSRIIMNDKDFYEGC